MGPSLEQLTQICKSVLYRAQVILDSLGDECASEVHDEHVTDISTRGDRAVSEAIVEYLKRMEFPAAFYDEELGRIELTRNPKYIFTLDDVDGTDNSYRGRGILPYCTVVSIFDSLEPKFKDVLVAGIFEHNSKRLWHAARGNGCYLNDVGVKTSGREIPDRRTSVIIDHYGSSEQTFKFLGLYEKVWVKDFGTSALGLAGVSSGMFDAFMNTGHKAHELGAGLLLIKEAGGSILELNGNSLDQAGYDFDAKYKIVAASTEKLGRKLLSMLK